MTKKFSIGDTEAIGYFSSEQLHRGKTFAFFGNWKAKNYSAEEQIQLFQAIEKWAHDLGAKTLVGPIDGSTYGNYRLKKDHFGSPAYFSEPQSTEEQLITMMRLGFEEEQGYSTYINNKISQLQDWISRFKGPDFEKLSKNYLFEMITIENWNSRLNELWELTNICFSENPFFQKLDLSEYQERFGEAFIRRACLKTSLFVVDKPSRKLAGSLVNFRGQNPSELIIKTVGIFPEHRHRGQMFLQLMKELSLHLEGVERLIFCLMKDGNFPSVLAKPLVHELRTYAVFSKAL